MYNVHKHSILEYSKKDIDKRASFEFQLKKKVKAVVFNRKYIAKIINPITKPQVLEIIKLTYTEIK